MPIRIPESQKKDLLNLLALPEPAFESLVEALKTVKPAMSPRALATSVAQSTGLSEDDLAGVLRAAISLYGTRERFALVTKDLISDVLDEAERSSLFPKGTQDARDSASKRLAKVLNLEKSVGVAAKSAEIALEQPNPYENARILTDVRPVFSSGDEVSATAAMVLHSLKLVSHGEEGHKVFYFSFSGSELRDLRDVIERALKKEAALKASLDKSGVPLIEVDFD